MGRREIPIPLAVGIILIVLVIVVALFWRQASPPSEAKLERWAPYPQIPGQQAQPSGAPQSPR